MSSVLARGKKRLSLAKQTRNLPETGGSGERATSGGHLRICISRRRV
jgi:hypothetical protein